MLNKLALGMSKSDEDGSSNPGSVGSAGVPVVGKETRSEMRDAGGGSGGGCETDEAVELLSTISIDSNGFDKKFTPHLSNPSGPSLLKETAPSHTGTIGITSATCTASSTTTGPTSIASSESHPPLSASVLSIDSISSQRFGNETSTLSVLEGNEPIAVKFSILAMVCTLLAKGWLLTHKFACNKYVDRTPPHEWYPDAEVVVR